MASSWRWVAKEKGAAAIFGPGTVIAEAALGVIDQIEAELA